MKKFFFVTAFIVSIIAIIILALASFAFFIYVFGKGVNGPGALLQWLKSTEILISLLLLSSLMFSVRVRKSGIKFLNNFTEKIFD